MRLHRGSASVDPPVGSSTLVAAHHCTSSEVLPEQTVWLRKGHQGSEKW